MRGSYVSRTGQRFVTCTKRIAYLKVPEAYSVGEITHVQHSAQPTLVPRNGFNTAPGALPR